MRQDPAAATATTATDDDDDNATLDVGDTLGDDVSVGERQVISKSSGDAECELTNCTCSLLCRRSSGDCLWATEAT